MFSLTVNYFAYALGVILVLYALGLGFTLWLLPAHLQKYLPIVAPSVGFCFLSFGAWNVYYFGARLDLRIAELLLIISMVSLTSFALTKGASGLRAGLTFRPVLAGLGFATLTFIILSLPIFWNAGSPTTVSLGNPDVTHYAATTRFLSEFGRFSTEGFVGQLGKSTAYRSLAWFADYTYFGVSAFSAVTGAILGLMPHQNTTLCVLVLFGCCAAATFLIASDTLRLPTATSCLVVILSGLQPVSLFVAVHGFFAQVAGSWLALMIFWVNTKLQDQPRTHPESLKLWILLIIFTLGLMLNYPHMLPFIYFFGVIYLSVSMWRRQYSQALGRYVLFNIGALLVAGVLCFQRIAPFLSLLKSAASVQAGWFIPWISPAFAIGLFCKTPLLTAGDWRINDSLSLVAGIVIGAICFSAWKKGNLPLVAMAVATSAIYIGSFALAISGCEDHILGGYKSFKLTSFFLPFFAPVVGSIFGVQVLPSKRFDRIGKGLIFLVLSASYYNANVGIDTALKQGNFRVERECDALLEIDRDKNVDSVNIFGRDPGRAMWEAYFLMHKKLYMEYDSYYASSDLRGTYDLLDKVTETEQVFHTRPNKQSNVRRINERFTLSMPQDRLITAKLVSGWHNPEPGHVWSGLGGRRASIILHSATESCGVRLTFMCTPLRPNDALQIRYGEESLSASETVEGDLRKIETTPFRLHQGDNTVNLTAQLDPVRPNSPDPRTLSFSFAAINIDLR